MIRFFKFACLWLAACSLAFLAPAQNLQHRRKAFRTPPASSWLLSETFEGTGFSGTAWTETSTPNEDYTTTVLAGSQSYSSTGTFQNAYVSFTGQTTVYAYCLLRRRSQSAQTDNTVFAIQTSGGTSLAGLGQNYSGGNTQFKLRCNGAWSTASATTQGAANTTTYHVWLTYVSGGTCELAMSTTGTKPTATGTGLVFIQATGASNTAARCYLALSDPDGSWIADNVFISTVPIDDSPVP